VEFLYAAAIVVVAIALRSGGFVVYVCAFLPDRYAEKLPWQKWMTLDDVASYGISRRGAIFALPVLYQEKCLEIRPRYDIEFNELEEEYLAERVGDSLTMHIYEFRLIKRRGGGRKKLRHIKISVPAWRPAH